MAILGPVFEGWLRFELRPSQHQRLWRQGLVTGLCEFVHQIIESRHRPTAVGIGFRQDLDCYADPALQGALAWQNNGKQLEGLPGVGFEVCVKIDRRAKVAAFCRELDGDLLAEAAAQNEMEPVFLQAAELLRAGSVGPELEADLDQLDALAKDVLKQGLYPPESRTYSRLPNSAGTGAGSQWWSCPRGWCAGRGRVRPGQDPPTCAAAKEFLVAGPLPE